MKWIPLAEVKKFDSTSIVRFIHTKKVLHEHNHFIEKHPDRINTLEYLDESPSDVSVLSDGFKMTYEALLHVFKQVSLIDLSDCKFEYGDDGNKKFINAGEPVVDSIMYDGNIFWMMNNDCSFSPLNPMKKAFQALAQYSTLTAPADEIEGSISKGEDQDECLLDISRFAANNKYKSPTLKGETASFVADIPKVIEYIKSKYHITKKQ